MKVKMKLYEKLANEHSKRFSKSWDYYAISMGAFLSGFRESKKINGYEEVEEEFKDGEQQLSVATFNKWDKEINNLSLKESMLTFLKNFDILDIRTHESSGTISFQGTAKRKL